MAHPDILAVKLMPKKVGYACADCTKAKKPHGSATHWLTSPEGKAISATCWLHGSRFLAEMRTLTPPQEWSLHPIHHEHNDDRMRSRGPICGHSHCVQNFIDTGNNACVPRMDA